MEFVRPAWLFEVASAFQRCALIAPEQIVSHVLDDLRAAVLPPSTPVEELILDSLVHRARHAIKAIDSEVPHEPLAVEDRALQLLHDRYPHPLTYRVIGRELGCDPEYLEVLFRKRTGQSIHSYLRRHRVSKALEAIRRGDKIEAAALQCGFRSKSGFIRACRAVTGAIPTVTTRQARARI
jgi:AraC-like DNA-binding protein